jgi:hypothetical protein
MRLCADGESRAVCAPPGGRWDARPLSHCMVRPDTREAAPHASGPPRPARHGRHHFSWGQSLMRSLARTYRSQAPGTRTAFAVIAPTIPSPRWPRRVCEFDGATTAGVAVLQGPWASGLDRSSSGGRDRFPRRCRHRSSGDHRRPGRGHRRASGGQRRAGPPDRHPPSTGGRAGATARQGLLQLVQAAVLGRVAQAPPCRTSGYPERLF